VSTSDGTRLDAIDRRGRAAARTLLDDLAARGADTLVAEDAPPATEPLVRPEPMAVPLDQSAVRGGRRVRRRRLLAAAVVAVLVAVAGAVTAATRDDGRPDVSSGGQPDHLLPGWLPPGFEPAHAIGIPDAAATGFGVDIAVYGDPDTDDPWSATLVVGHIVADEELLGGLPADGEVVTVAGHDARLRETDGFLDGGPGPGWEVGWEVDDGRLFVSGSLTRDEVLAAAAAASAEPAVDASGLPDGYEELARGPFVDSPLFTSLFEGAVEESGGDDTGLAVTYADAAATDTVRTGVVVAQRRGPASAVDLLRLWLPDADATTVRNRHAVIGRGSEPPGSAGEDGVVAVQWAEPEGQLVTVVGFGVPEDDVLQVAEGLRPAGADEVAALRDESAVPAPREFGAPQAREVVVASGQSQTGRWRIVANTRKQDNIGALTIDRLWGAIASTSSTTGDRVEPPLDLQIDVSDGTIVIWGVDFVDAASVTVEAPGSEPLTLDTHAVEGWTHRVVADAFPDDLFASSDGTVSVVARDADGREVGRNSTVLDSGG